MPLCTSSRGDNVVPVRKLSLELPGTDAILIWRAPEVRSADGKARRDEATPPTADGLRLLDTKDLVLLHCPTSYAWPLDS